MSAREAIAGLQKSVEQQIRGQGELVRQILVGLLANGHLLLESLPGLAKTRTVKAFAAQLDAQMRRVQFTPDLLPADITGSDVLFQENGQNVFRFQAGPIFGNLILADEINRAPAKVQSALLEAMEERQVSVGGNTHAMPELFLVLATQNPIEQEGTYPLPEAQMDRFLMKVLISYPDAESEREVLKLVRGEELGARAQADAGTRISQDVVFAARAEVHAVHVADAIDRYVVDLVNATRAPKKYDDTLASWIQVGSSPRGAIGLDRAARASAWLAGRDHVTPEDVRAVAHPVLRHRLILSYDANADGVSADAVVDRLIERVAIPA